MTEGDLEVHLEPGSTSPLARYRRYTVKVKIWMNGGWQDYGNHAAASFPVLKDRTVRVMFTCDHPVFLAVGSGPPSNRPWELPGGTGNGMALALSRASSGRVTVIITFENGLNSASSANGIVVSAGDVLTFDRLEACDEWHRLLG